MKIGVFDSGVGGLSVLKKLKEKVDFADVVYYADTLNSPYGRKSVEEVEALCLKIGEFLIDNRVDIIIIACNTATVASLEALSERFTSVPIIGVIEPGATMAIQQSKNKKIGVLATPLTAKTKAYEHVIKKLDSSYEVSQKGCDLLCPMIEKGWTSDEESMNILKSYMDDLPEDVDTIVLGCTHYPFIREDVQSLAQNKNIVDPADEAAMQVLIELNRAALVKGIRKRKREMNIEYFVSGDVEKFKEVAESFLNEEIPNVYHHPLTD